MNILASGRGRSFAHLSAGVAVAALAFAALGQSAARAADAPACANGGLTLSPGFCASIIADNLGHLRHLALSPDGLWVLSGSSDKTMRLWDASTGDGYVVRFYPEWKDYPTGDVAADVRTMNAFIEDRVREMPEQYFWAHKRFKTRPPGESSPYKKEAR